MRTQDGKVASGIEEEFTCWKNHFGRVLNQECSTTVAKIGEVVDTLNIDTEVPKVEEVKQAIKLFKNWDRPKWEKLCCCQLPASFPTQSS